MASDTGGGGGDAGGGRDGTATPEGGSGEDGSHRILLVVDGGENRRLLVEWLREEGHEVVVADPADPDGYLPATGDDGDGDGAGTATGFAAAGETHEAPEAADVDLCVVDAVGARRVGDRLAALRRARHPAFLPVLLVVPERATGRGGRIDPALFEALEVTVDDVVPVPVRKGVLARRIRTLLRARSYSVELAERKEQYRRLVETTPEAIFLVREGEVVFCNEAARALLAGGRDPGLAKPSGEFEGEQVVERFVEDDREAVETLLATIGTGGPPPEYVEASLRDDRGETVSVEVTGVRVPYAGGTATQLVVRDMSDRKRRERRLRVYGRALEEASVGVSIADVTQPDDPLVYVNRSFEAITGYAAPEILGRNCRVLQGPDTDPDTVAAIRETIEAEDSGTFTLRNYRQDGTQFWNELELTPVPGPEGEVTHYLGFQRDVTDRVERERQLEALHATTRELMAAETTAQVCSIAVETAEEVLEMPAAAVYLYDEGSGRLRPAAATDGTMELFGDLPTFGPGEAIAWEVFEAGEARVVDDVTEHEAVYDPGTRMRSELFVPLGEHGVMVSGSTDPGAFGESDVRFARTLGNNVVAALDRAEREGQLRERTRKLETRVSQGKLVADLGRRAVRGEDIDDLFSAAVEGLAETLDAAYAEVLEYRAAADDLLFRAVTGLSEDLVDEVTIQAGRKSQGGFTLLRNEPVVMEDVATEDRFDFDPDLLAEYGIESGIAIVIGSPDDPWGVLGVHDAEPREFADEDTDFVRSVATLLATAIDRRDRERELERFETIVRAAGEPIYTLDAGGHFVDANEALAAVTGYDVGELLGEHASLVLDDVDIARAERAIRDLLRGETDDATVELTINRADGERRLCLVNIAALPAEDGFRGTVGVLRDITERRRREQRMEVMDRILRHNLRNEMNVVRGRAELVRKVAGGTPEVDDHLAEITSAAESLLSLSEGARRFHEAFEDGSTRFVRVDLAEVVEGVLDAHRERHPAATFETDLPGRATVEAHPAIRVAVEELVENALAHHHREDPRIRVAATREDGTVDLAVADDGPGLPAFERKSFEGEVESALEHASGLGLWLVNWIVTSSGGEVSCEDNHPQGTVMRIRLPAAD